MVFAMLSSTFMVISASYLRIFLKGIHKVSTMARPEWMAPATK